MGWQTRLTGSLRMSPEAARELLALGHVDWYADGQSFAEYLGLGDRVPYDEAARALVLELGWVTWRLHRMMDLFAALKDSPEIDELVHHSPTYDAWYESGSFFVAPGRWGYVGAGPMLESKTTRGPDVPTVADVREWREAGPLARHVRVVDDTHLEIEAVRAETFRCAAWELPSEVPLWTPDFLQTGRLADGGATVTFTWEGREHRAAVRELWLRREREPQGYR